MVKVTELNVFIASEKYAGEDFIEKFYEWVVEFDDTAQMVISGDTDKMNINLSGSKWKKQD